MNQPHQKPEKYRWGIFGTGRMADIFASELNLHARSEIAWVASKSGDRARVFAKTHDIPRHFGTFEPDEALDAVDVVYIATTNDHHLANARWCAKGGKAVLLEKPACLNTRDLQTLLDTVKEHPTFLMEAMWMRCFPVIRDLPKTLERITPITSMAASFCIDKPFEEGSRLYSTSLGGGVLYDLGVYPLNLAHILFGLDGCRVESDITRAKTGVDEEATLQLTYPGGITANFTCSFKRAGAHRATITGERGEVVLDDFFHPSKLTVLPHGVAPEVTELTYPIMGYDFEIEEVIRCLEIGAFQSDLMPHRYTFEVLQLIENIL